MAKISPTQNTLKFLRAQGYTVQVVEKFIIWTKQRVDLFGFIDVVAIHPDKAGVLGVQTTSKANISTRIKKAEALDAYRLWLEAGNRVEFHGWHKKKNRWEVEIRRAES